MRLFFEEELIGALEVSQVEGEPRFQFTYSEGWLSNQEAFALSVALPLRAAPYQHQQTRSYIENLLPEGEVITHLRRYARQKGELTERLSDESYFLRRFGVDCAGAIVITEGEQPPLTDERPALRPLDLDVIYAHLDARRPLTSEVVYHHGGRFSLAGAQDKFPLIYQDNTLMIPTNGAATTHILKPMIRGALGDWNTPLNELLCMRLARELGLQAPRVTLMMNLTPFTLFVVVTSDLLNRAVQLEQTTSDEIRSATLRGEAHLFR